jgi:hypothetical protein
MPTFGLITEGVTDQKVIQAIFTGIFDPEEIDIRPFLPIADNTCKHQLQNFSNWELVLAYCASPKFEEAFPFVDYVVVHIDTDQCDDPKFGVRKEREGVALSPQEMVLTVSEKLKERIGEPTWSKYQERIVFAIAVETTECWLLPLYVKGKEISKHLNCLNVLNTHLRRRDLETINPAAKRPMRYAELARPYNKRKELMKNAPQNPSLDAFVKRLEALRISLLPAETDVSGKEPPL